MQRFVMVSFGLLLLLVGAVMLPLPPPFAFGAVMVIAGLAILASWSKTVRRWMQEGRSRYPKFSGWLEHLSARLPRFLRRPLRRTHPAPLNRLKQLRARLKLRRSTPLGPRAPTAPPAAAPIPVRVATARPRSADSTLPEAPPDR